MKLTKEHVHHIARLAHITVRDDEEEAFVRQLAEIVSFMDTIQQADAPSHSYKYHVEGLSHVVRNDIVAKCDDAAQELLRSHFPDREGDFLRVPAVFSDSDSSSSKSED